MIPELLLDLICGVAIGFVFGIYYADSSNRRMETDSAVRQALAQIQLLRSEVQRALYSIKSRPHRPVSKGLEKRAC